MAFAVVRLELGDKQGAIEDLQMAAKYFYEAGEMADYQKPMEMLRELQQ